MIHLPLHAPPEAVHRVIVRFVTPTEIKSDTPFDIQPGFESLVSRLRDRISTLRTLYGEGPLDIDFRGMAARAAAVSLVKSDLHHVEVERRSSRTGQRHSLGGFVGSVVYEGDLREFVPYLKIGEAVGVGRQTPWGKGELSVSMERTFTPEVVMSGRSAAW